jgi:hypothetical protein
MANIERRNIRIEDWEGNIYYPETQSGSSLAGRIVDAEDATTDLTSSSVTITEGSLVAENTANNGTAIMIASPTADKILFQTAIAGIPFGKVAVNMRVKSNKVTASLNLMKVEIYYYDSLEESDGTLLETKTITGADIGTVNKFVDYMFTTDFSGTYTSSTCFKIKIIALSGNGSTLHFDQIAIAKAMPTA